MRQLTEKQVDGFVGTLRRIEDELEAAARSICDADGGVESFNTVRLASSYVHDAIHTAFRLRPGKENKLKTRL